MSALWPDSFVEEANLTFTVSALRKALGDGQDGEQFIQTVPTRGYRFVAPVTREGNLSISSTSGKAPGSIPALLRRIGIVAVALGVVAILSVFVRQSRKTTDSSPTRFTIPLPDSAVVAASSPEAQIPVAQISPDGRRVAFIVQSYATTLAVPRIWLRSIDALQAEEMAGSEGASALFWAPNSQQLAFVTRSALKKLRVSDGTVQTLCDTCQPTGGGTWSRNGMIVFPSEEGSLLGIRDGGGALEAVTTIDRSKREIAHVRPQFLPDGQRFLYVIQNVDPGLTGLYVGQVGSTERRLLFKGEQPAIYAARGYLLFPLAGNLVARPFDLTRLEFSGDPIPLFPLSSFAQDWRGRIIVSASDTGSLTHAIVEFRRQQFQWVGRTGEPQRLVGEPGPYQSFDLSSDGRWLAFSKWAAGLWVHDLEHDRMQRLTYGDTSYTDPRWMGDSQRLVATRWRPEPQAIVQISRDGSVLVIHSTPAAPSALDDVSRDGRYLLYRHRGLQLLAKPLGQGSGGGSVVRKAPSGTMDQARFSPDGRWIAYNANETDRFEVYVTPFPASGETQPISSGGGVQPVWRDDGRELYYLGLNGFLHAVEMRPDGKRLHSSDRQLFQTGITPSSSIEQYSASADGQRFLILKPVDNKVRNSIGVVLNWPALLTASPSR